MFGRRVAVNVVRAQDQAVDVARRAADALGRVGVVIGQARRPEIACILA
jgi:hypothetical protein